MVDLSGYNLVFEDDFNGARLDEEKWEYRAEGKYAGGFLSKSQVRVENGNLVITGQYLEDGEFGPGWYAAMVRIKKRFLRGYFEIRCICSKMEPPNEGSLWSAFVLQARNPYNAEVSRGGPGGAEIDVFEGVCHGGRDGVELNIHCKGVKGSTSGPGQTDHIGLGRFYPPNLCSDYNIFGLEWTSSEYVFYINGGEVSRTSYGDGVSEVDEEVIVDLSMPVKVNHQKGFKTEFITDYVRVYQKAE